MSVDTGKETLEFQTEVKQLLHLMIHSLYSNKEIFLRELISNGSDACDKLRFEALGNEALYEDEPNLRLRVSCDPEARTVTVSDNGIGMTADEIRNYINQIAFSGAEEFLEKYKDKGAEQQIIGFFGLGFYSAFMVADKVEVSSRRAGSAQGARWTSTADGSYTLEDVEGLERGTRVVLHLKPLVEEDEGGAEQRVPADALIQEDDAPPRF